MTTRNLHRPSWANVQLELKIGRPIRVEDRGVLVEDSTPFSDSIVMTLIFDWRQIWTKLCAQERRLDELMDPTTGELYAGVQLEDNGIWGNFRQVRGLFKKFEDREEEEEDEDED
jgi:hypothetical protein